MNFPGKMWLMIIFNVTKNQGFTFSLEDSFLEKPKWRRGAGQIDTKAFLGLNLHND